MSAGLPAGHRAGCDLTQEQATARIRPALISDAARLAEFAGRVFWEAYSKQMRVTDVRAYIAEHFAVEQQTLELAHPSIRTLLAETDGDLVGYAQVKLGSVPACGLAGELAELQRIYVEPSRQSHGLGGRLLEACESSARDRGANQLWLSVWKPNARAIAFYERHGFRIVGEQPFRVGTDLQSDHLMAKGIWR